MDASSAAQLFGPYDPIPEFTVPPQDPALVQRIAKLAEFVKRVGPHFVTLLKNKQKDNPEYSFLFGGEGADYYWWVLYCTVYGHSPDQPLGGSHFGYQDTQGQPSHPGQFQQQQQQPPQPQPQSQQQIQHPPPHIQSIPTQSQTQPVYEASAAPGQSHQDNASTQGGPDLKGHLAEGLNLPMEVGVGFAQVLEGLNGSKDSIKASQNWFMACSQFADGLAMMMARRVQQLGDFNSQLHIVYLANDILFKSLSHRQPGQLDIVANAFKPVLGSMLATPYMYGGQSTEVKQRLMKILSFWADRGVFDHQDIVAYEQAMMTGNTTLVAHFSPSQVLPPASGAMGSGPQSGQHQHQEMHRMPSQEHHGMMHPDVVKVEQSGGPMPSALPWQNQGHQMREMNVAPSQGLPWQQGTDPSYSGFHHPPMDPMHCWPPGQAPAHQPGWVHPLTNPPPNMFPPEQPAADFRQPPVIHSAFDPPPETAQDGPPVNPMAFPPGLIPKLVRDKGRQLMPYSPLGPLEIDQAGLPPPPDGKDPYLRSRLEKFYADLDEYRPGVVRLDIEGERRGEGRSSRSARDGEEEGRGRSRRKKRSGFDMVADPTTSMMPDGSYAGPESGNSSQYAGLGTNARRETNEDDVYQSYRKMRSDVYHQSITRVAPPPRPERGRE
ncbi:hypothetical protein BSKO_02095 [Bryopsis sp. KO-2023]|nr:hypothetical protein BSKO_02095 [Bryopsis sp. KO-2023]